MQKITNAELKANARKAYDDRRLTAQHGPESGYCVYYAKLDDGRDCGCGIGVSLTAQTVRRVLDAGLNCSAVDGLTAYAGVEFEDKRFARELQLAHDVWCDAVRHHPNLIKPREQAFLQLIDHPAAGRRRRFPR
jgi:hypothetical protein